MLGVRLPEPRLHGLPECYRGALTSDGSWVLWRPPGDAPFPEQGWKLHVSSDPADLDEMLQAVMPILGGHGAIFKHAASLDFLRDLNEGKAGLSQIGKALTVYCGDAIEPLGMVTALDAATLRFAAPRIRFEPCFRGRGNVYVRYGAFQGLRFRLPTGAIVPAIRSPNGHFIPDDRRHVARDPVLARAGFQQRRGPPTVVAERYALVQRIFETPRGDVLSAIDVKALRKCIAKTAFRGDGRAPDGSDALQRLAAEAEMLHAAEATGCTPHVLAYESFAEGAVLVMEHLDGEDLVAWMQARPYAGSRAEMNVRLGLFDRICGILDALGAAGVRPLDLSAQNIRIEPGGKVRLLDLEHAQQHGKTLAVQPRGTPGYAPPAGSTADAVVHALSAILYMLLTGIEPSRHPAPEELVSLSVRDLNPAVSRSLAEVVGAGLSGGFARPACLRRAVAEAAARPRPSRSGQPAVQADPRPNIDAMLRDWIGTRFPERQAEEDRCAYSGLAGVAAYALAADFDSDCLASLARLLAVPAKSALSHPGLLVGDGGRALVLHGLALRLGNAALAQAAVDLALEALAKAPASPDLMNGRAGMLVLASRMHRRTGAPEFASRGRALARALTAATDWTIPAGYGDLSGTAWRGAAHGEAGILLALRGWYSGGAAGPEPALVARRLHALYGSMTAPAPRRRKSGWPQTADGRGFGGYTWCHGSVGIVRTLMVVSPRGTILTKGPLAGVLKGLAIGSAGLGPCVCHGLAGTVDLLVDLEKLGLCTAEARHLRARLERIMIQHVLASRHDRNPDIGLYTGLAGIAWALARSRGAIDLSPHDFVAGG